MALSAASPIEQQIVGRIIDHALENDYYVSVDDGEDITLIHSQDKKMIEDALATTDEDQLLIYKRVVDKTAMKLVYLGCVYLIYGNDEDVISDSSVSLIEFLKPVEDWVSEQEGWQ